MGNLLRVVYMGTPRFAVPPLVALANTEDVVLVVTQPDRRAGRGRKTVLSPVKEEAVKQLIPCFQPDSIKAEETVGRLRSSACDLIVVAAFGQILTPEVLEVPKYGCINIHASLLPKYRGASPISAAIIEGEERTGITTMMMDRGMDTGDMLVQLSLEIDEQETTGMLSERLSLLGARAILETLQALKEGKLDRTPQQDSAASYAPVLRKEDGEIDWRKDPIQIMNHVRGMDPWPGAFTYFQDRLLKIWRVTPSNERGRSGAVLQAEGRLIVGAGGGSVAIDELQLPGKTRVSVTDFLRGNQAIRKGTTFGTL
jgi:methionyl-tRNA formyltransferase